MSKRQVFRSIHSGAAWVVERDGRVISRHATQADSEEAASAAAKALHGKGSLSQAVFHRRDGEIKGESTYGEDPRDIPG
jgi:hypothetical protein